MDIGAKDAVLGLTARITAAEICRACMEDVTCEMRVNYEALHGLWPDKMYRASLCN